MRRLIAVVLLTGFSSCALAQAPLESCTEVPELAADVMRNRQVNYDIMLLINRMSGELSDHAELLSWVQSMIDMAYSQPAATTSETRNQQVEDFQTLWQARCLSKMGK